MNSTKPSKEHPRYSNDYSYWFEGDSLVIRMDRFTEEVVKSPWYGGSELELGCRISTIVDVYRQGFMAGARTGGDMARQQIMQAIMPTHIPSR